MSEQQHPFLQPGSVLGERERGRLREIERTFDDVGEAAKGLVVNRYQDIRWLIDQANLAFELGDLLPKKQLTIDRLRELLGRLEWIGEVADRGAWCPACYQDRDDGHAPDCWLAAALRNGEDATP